MERNGKNDATIRPNVEEQAEDGGRGRDARSSPPFHRRSVSTPSQLRCRAGARPLARPTRPLERGSNPCGAGELRVGRSRSERQAQRVFPRVAAVEGRHESGEERVAAADRISTAYVQDPLEERAVGRSEHNTLRAARDDPRMPVAPGHVSDLRRRRERVVAARRRHAEEPARLGHVHLDDIGPCRRAPDSAVRHRQSRATRTPARRASSIRSPVAVGRARRAASTRRS